MFKIEVIAVEAGKASWASKTVETGKTTTW
jgi:hypothetical protein